MLSTETARLLASIKAHSDKATLAARFLSSESPAERQAAAVLVSYHSKRASVLGERLSRRPDAGAQGQSNAS